MATKDEIKTWFDENVKNGFTRVKADINKILYVAESENMLDDLNISGSSEKFNESVRLIYDTALKTLHLNVAKADKSKKTESKTTSDIKKKYDIWFSEKKITAIREKESAIQKNATLTDDQKNALILEYYKADTEKPEPKTDEPDFS
ncbi:MAG: hypothetical protein ACTSQY_10505 [Candidatus Odinarchaeia archaeon]